MEIIAGLILYAAGEAMREAADRADPLDALALAGFGFQCRCAGVFSLSEEG